MPTLYELKQSLGMIGQQLKNKTRIKPKATDQMLAWTISNN